MIFGGWRGILFSERRKNQHRGHRGRRTEAAEKAKRDRRFFCRGGRGRLRGIYGDWGGWRWQGRSQCGCARVAVVGCPVRGLVAQHSLGRVPMTSCYLLWIRLVLLRLCFPSLSPCLYFDTNGGIMRAFVWKVSI